MGKRAIICGYCGAGLLDRQKLKVHTKAKHKSAEPLEADADDEEHERPCPKASKADLTAFRQKVLAARSERSIPKTMKM